MEILHALPEYSPAEQTVIALGSFDGVHLGHQALISRAVQKAKKIGGKSIILTFDPHPLKLLKPEKSPQLLLTKHRKSIKIAELGADLLVFLPFTKDLAAMASEAFIGMLYQALSPHTVVVGFNYTYGQGGSGNSFALKMMGSKLGFAVEVLPPQKAQGELISSTSIRHALAEGDAERARRFLGYWPILEGQVIPGEKRGRTLGFPTANVDISTEILLPRLGVYAAKSVLAQRTYQAVVNIGRKPTFGEGRPPVVEVHLLDFQENLYGNVLELSLLKYLRSEKRFLNSRDLTEQIQQDISQTRRICSHL